MRYIKYVIICLSVICNTISYSQQVIPRTITTKPIVSSINDGAYFLMTSGNNDTLKRAQSTTINSYILRKDTVSILATQYYVLTHSTGSTFNGQRPITATSFPTGLNPNTTTIAAFLEKVFYPSTSPTATIGLGVYTLNREFATAGSDAATISWSVTRPAYCTALASTVVDGIAITPNPNPAEGATSSGTRSTTITRNSNKTFTNTVTSSDGKTGSASVSVAWYWKRYWGTHITINPADANIIAGSSEFATTYIKSAFNVNGGGNYVFIAYPAAWGSGVQIWVNGLNSTAAFTLTTRSFVNASGGSTSYNIFVSNNTIGGTISIELK